MNQQNFKRTSGFSLIELAVVIAIVALLAAVAIPAYKNYIAKARMAQIYSLLQSQLDFVEQSYATKSTYGKLLIDTGLSRNGMLATPTSTGGTIVINFLPNSTLVSPLFDTPMSAVITYTATTHNGGKLDWTTVPCTVGPADNPQKQAIQASFFPKCKVL